MNMANEEMIKCYNRLFAIQDAEKVYYKKHNEQFFKGRIKITYAIKKNMIELKDKLKPYNESFEELRREYFDVEAEEADLKKRRSEYQKKLDNGEEAIPPEREEILLDGKDRGEYEEKLADLLQIKVEDVSVHTIKLELLDGISLSSGDLDALSFMIEDF